MQRRRSEQPVPALLIRPSPVKPGHLGHLGEFPLGSWPLLISHSHPPTCHGCKVTVCSPSPWCQKEVVTAGTGPQSRALRETLTPASSTAHRRNACLSVTQTQGLESLLPAKGMWGVWVFVCVCVFVSVLCASMCVCVCLCVSMRCFLRVWRVQEECGKKDLRDSYQAS